jgi:hypothetical protein
MNGRLYPTISSFIHIDGAADGRPQLDGDERWPAMTLTDGARQALPCDARKPVALWRVRRSGSGKDL